MMTSIKNLNGVFFLSLSAIVLLISVLGNELFKWGVSNLIILGSLRHLKVLRIVLFRRVSQKEVWVSRKVSCLY